MGNSAVAVDSCGDDGIIDNGEDGNNQLRVRDGRNGYWYTAFWARKGGGSVGKVRLKVPDGSTTQEGGKCRECFNDFGADLNLSEALTHYVFPFKKMRQEPDWGSPRPRFIDKSKLYGMQWQVNTPGATFDIWIDDVEFVGCE